MSDIPSPVKLTPPAAKRGRQTISWQQCIICQTSSSEKLCNSTSKGRSTLVCSIEHRKDDVYRRLIDEYQTIENVPVENIKYHSSCYRSFTSKHNLSSTVVSVQNPLPPTSNDDVPFDGASINSTIRTRSMVSKLSDTDWSVCIFCKCKSYKQQKKLYKITSDERTQSISNVAKLLSDSEILYKVSCDDFSEKALYHPSCITNYLLKRVKQEDDDNQPSEHERAFNSFVSNIKDELLVHKKVYYLSQLLELYSSYLPENIRDSYTTQRLQIKLEKYFGETIIIQPQLGQGMSNIVYSSSISLSEAIKTANRLKAEIKFVEMHDLSSVNEAGLDEQQILHAAASILRRDITQIRLPLSEYPAPNDVSLNRSLEFVPTSLKQFLTWLLEDGAYEAVQSDFPLPQEKYRKCMALAESIISIQRNSFTPFHLGLALQLHHQFGSKYLVETINSHGFCASYNEVRRYLTSSAEHEVNKIESGTYLPYGISSISDTQTLIQEGADNVDINTETIDGKDTFHSMGRAVFQVRSTLDTPVENVRIKRLHERSFQITDTSSDIIGCMTFNKPKERVGPVRSADAFSQIRKCEVVNAHTSDLAWVFLRLLSRKPSIFPMVYHPNTSDQTIPFWTGYYRETTKHSKSFNVVAYPPIIDSKPTDMATVYTTMKRCADMTNKAGQKFSVQTFDQQLYAIAQQVKWSNPIEFQHHILRLGGFHTLATFIACIGKIWGDGGLSDLLADSGVYAPCTVEQMLSGKQFNRAVRALTLAYEALLSLWLSAFFSWCEINGHLTDLPADVWNSLAISHQSFKDFDIFSDNIKIFQSHINTHLLPLMKEFRKYSYEASATFQYWDTFLQAAEIMLQNIRAERDGIWSLHVGSLQAMLPFFFVANRNNYSRWTPIYIIEMLNLPSEIKSCFEAGLFSIRQKPGSFNGIWTDMATEKTVIKDSKGNGGIIGLTRQKSALIRWNLTRHIVGHFSASMRARSGLLREDDETHDESRPTCMKRDDQHVSVLVEHVDEKMINPFDIEKHPKELINISTGLHASKDVQDSLSKVVETGTNMSKRFIESTLSENMSGSFFGPIQRSNLKTFTDMHKKTKLKCRSGDIIKTNVNPELIFRRALALTQCRDDVTVEKLMSFPIGPIPTSIFHDDGMMRKCVKSDLARELEKDVCSSFTLPPFEKGSSVLIRDGMSVIQSMDVKKASNFGDLAKSYLKQQSIQFESVTTLIDVFDRYDVKDSIKSAERERRTIASSGHKVYQVNEGSSIPDWKRFLGNSKNKQALVSFLGTFCSDFYQTKQPLAEGLTLYLAGSFYNPEVVKKVVANQVSDCVALYSTQEEADTRIILHVLDMDEQFGQRNVKGRIVIKSSDTDVMVLCIHYFHCLKSTEQLWLFMGSVSSGKDGRRYIPVHEICSSLSNVICEILPAVHAITGCDSTSAFYGIGKKSVFKVVKESPHELHCLTCLAESDIDCSINASRKLIATLYDTKGKFASCHGDLNKLRVKLATTKDSALARLPPCEASFRQHVLRCCIQTKIWMTSHQPKPPFISPFDYGWQKGISDPEPVLFLGMMSSDFLQDLICTCKGKSVCSRGCICFEQSLSCTELCPCQASDLCKNGLTSQEIVDDEGD